MVRTTLINKMILLARAVGDQEFQCKNSTNYEPKPVEVLMLGDPIGFTILLRTILFEEVSDVFEPRLIEPVCCLSFRIIQEIEEEYRDYLDDDDAVAEREGMLELVESITLEFLRKMTTSKMQIVRLFRKSLSEDNQLFSGYLITLMSKLGFEISVDQNY